MGLPTDDKRLSIYGSSFVGSYLLNHNTKNPKLNEAWGFTFYHQILILWQHV